MNNDGYDIDKGRDYMIADIYLRLTALENLLITKELITDAELQEHLRLLAARLADILGMPVEHIPALQTPKTAVIVNDRDDAIKNKDILKLLSFTSKKISKDN